MQTSLALTNITKRFGGVVALNQVNISIESGVVHGLVGENGAGKSTLAKIICGIIKPDIGEITLNGKPVIIHNANHAIELGIALIPQELELVPFLSVAESIYLGSEPTRLIPGMVDRKQLFQKCKELLDELEIDINPTAKVMDLSISQQQLVVIARAFSKNAKILLMDEPTSRLGPEGIDALLNYVVRLKNKGIAIIYISHHIDEIFRVCDVITILRDGQLTGFCKTSETNTDDIVQRMVGRHVERGKLQDNTDIGDVILQVKNIARKRYAQGISFELHRGEILGIAGLIGAGRTELIRAILGIDSREEGQIFIEGKPAKINSYKDAIKCGLVLVPEERIKQGLILSMGIRENISLPILKRLTRWFGYLDAFQERKIANGLMDRLHIKASSSDAPVRSLSGGNQQKVVLAKWLNINAKVYIFDEPTRGIDVLTKSEIHKIIQDLASKGAGVIVISSELPEILALSNRVLVMREGILSAILVGGDISEKNIMQNAIIGENRIDTINRQEV